jgi:hypothetical protein
VIWFGVISAPGKNFWTRPTAKNRDSLGSNKRAPDSGKSTSRPNLPKTVYSVFSVGYAEADKADGSASDAFLRHLHGTHLIAAVEAVAVKGRVGGPGLPANKCEIWENWRL